MRIDNTASAKIKINVTDDGRYLIHSKKVSGRRYISKLVIQNTIASDSGVISCSVRRLSTVIERQFKVQIHGKYTMYIFLLNYRSGFFNG